jgi:hypothetical protein
LSGRVPAAAVVLGQLGASTELAITSGPARFTFGATTTAECAVAASSAGLFIGRGNAAAVRLVSVTAAGRRAGRGVVAAAAKVAVARVVERFVIECETAACRAVRPVGAGRGGSQHPHPGPRRFDGLVLDRG